MAFRYSAMDRRKKKGISAAREILRQRDVPKSRKVAGFAERGVRKVAECSRAWKQEGSKMLRGR